MQRAPENASRSICTYYRSGGWSERTRGGMFENGEARLS